MAHFIGYLQGNRGEVSRLGTKASGIDARVRGWDIGARVCVKYNKDKNRDEVSVYRTSGSNGSESDELLMKFCEKKRIQIN